MASTESALRAARKHYAANREKVRANVRAHYGKNCEEKRQYGRDYYQRNRYSQAEVRREYRYNRHFGITIAEYDRMLEEQGGVCVTCGSEPRSRRLHVDHCHDSGRVRGLLCGSCNRAIGLLCDDPARAMAVSEYLKRSMN